MYCKYSSVLKPILSWADVNLFTNIISKNLQLYKCILSEPHQPFRRLSQETTYVDKHACASYLLGIYSGFIRS
jgi:hypothetical protein